MNRNLENYWHIYVDFVFVIVDDVVDLVLLAGIDDVVYDMNLDQHVLLYKLNQFRMMEIPVATINHYWKKRKSKEN